MRLLLASPPRVGLADLADATTTLATRPRQFHSISQCFFTYTKE